MMDSKISRSKFLQYTASASATVQRSSLESFATEQTKNCGDKGVFVDRQKDNFKKHIPLADC